MATSGEDSLLRRSARGRVTGERSRARKGEEQAAPGSDLHIHRETR